MRSPLLGPVSFALEAGECAAVSGPSGAGKTLLLRALADLDPHEGEVYLDGVACRRFPAPRWRRCVGLLAAESAWWGETVRVHLRGVSAQALDSLGFGPQTLDWEVRRLSTGERQRLALLRLLANDPQVLLLDEPTANLDREGRERVEGLVRRYREERGVAVVWVAHDGAQIARVATHRYGMERGAWHELGGSACG